MDEEESAVSRTATAIAGDTRTVFLGGLSWPTGIVPYDDGVFIAVESANAITLKRAQGASDSVARDQIATIACR
jgi:hypothetical protein